MQQQQQQRWSCILCQCPLVRPQLHAFATYSILGIVCKALHAFCVCIRHPPLPAGWDEGATKYLLRELLIHQELSACHHPHIVELKDVFLTPTHLAAVLEYVEGENLQTV